MPISGTGKGECGFTLLEMITVILLIGLCVSLAYPRVSRTEERTRIKYIGELLRADLKQAQEDAKTEQSPKKISFDTAGYSFEIGEIPITRKFPWNHFRFVTASTAETQGSTEIEFTPDGVAPETTLNWETGNYRGALRLQRDGTVNWRYEAK